MQDAKCKGIGPTLLVHSALCILHFAFCIDRANAAAPNVAPVTALAATPDGAAYLSASQRGVVLHPAGWRVFLPTKLEHVHALAFSPDGKTLAVAGGSPAEKGVVELWSWPEAKRLGELTGHADVVYDVVFCDNGVTLATASGDRTIKLWNVAKRDATHTLEGHSGPVLCLALSPDGKLLCSGSVDQTIRVWDVAARKLLRSMDNHLGPVHALAFQPGVEKDRPATLASGSGDRTVRIWQPSIGRMVRIIRHPAAVHALMWREDGGALYSGAADGTIRTLAADASDILEARKVRDGQVTALLLWRGRVTSPLAK
jgi:WD40 repeat protein